MQKRDVLNSPRIRELRKKQANAVKFKLAMFVFLFSVFMLSLSLLSHWDKLEIQKIEVSGNKIIQTQNIIKVVESELSQRYFFVFSKKNFLIYPKNQIASRLAEEFQRLTDIKVSLLNINSLEVELSERAGFYTWCGDYPPDLETIEEDLDCYFVDQVGFVFDEAPYFSGDVYFRFFGGLEVNSKPIGSTISKDIFSQLLVFKSNIEKMSLNPVAVFIKNDGDIEYLLSKNTKGIFPKILLNSKNDLGKTTENLQTALGSEPLKEELAKNYSNFEYIDLRFGNKVYYHFK